jgi:hypothetical protein
LRSCATRRPSWSSCSPSSSPAAPADSWLPRAADASWTYEWQNSVYSTTPTKEKVTVAEQRGALGDPFGSGVRTVWWVFGVGPLRVYGCTPILPAYPRSGAAWSARVPSRDFSVFVERGTTRVLRVQRVRVPAGTFQALVVQSRLTQVVFPFGSGTRTSYFAPGRGLVTLVFRHGDGSVSTVELQRFQQG